jgi:hypothetical protein
MIKEKPLARDITRLLLLAQEAEKDEVFNFDLVNNFSILREKYGLARVLVSISETISAEWAEQL